jgi:hypothetical protein
MRGQKVVDGSTRDAAPERMLRREDEIMPGSPALLNRLAAATHRAPPRPLTVVDVPRDA